MHYQPSPQQPDPSLASRYFRPEDLSRDQSAILQAYNRTVALECGSTIGTGVILANQWLLTCNHVLEELIGAGGFEHAVAQSTSGGVALRNAKVELTDTDLDVAVIRCSALPALSPITIVLDPSECLGDTCYFVGNPRYATIGRPDPGPNAGQVISIGKLTEYERPHIYVFGPTINPGHSGGPVVAENGALLGMISNESRNGARGISMVQILERILAAG